MKLCYWLSLPALAVVCAAAASQAPVPAEIPGRAYELQAGDVVDFRFYFTPELNEKAQVRPDGKVSLGLIGEVTAAGKSIAQLTAELQERYKGQLKNPSISVQVDSFANRKVFVGGEVLRPGLIELMGERTVLSAILESGGITKNAKKEHVLVVRRSNSGAPETFRLSMEKKDQPSAQAASFLLRPFDVVLVSESRISRVNRAVDQYVFKFIPPQLTLGFTYLLNAAVIF